MNVAHGHEGEFTVRVSFSLKMILAFTSIYTIWGSTYLGIKFAIQTIPPFLMAGTRFMIAGLILYLWTWTRGVRRPSITNWKAASIIGGSLLLGGNGGVGQNTTKYRLAWSRYS